MKRIFVCTESNDGWVTAEAAALAQLPHYIRLCFPRTLEIVLAIAAEAEDAAAYAFVVTTACPHRNYSRNDVL